MENRRSDWEDLKRRTGWEVQLSEADGWHCSSQSSTVERHTMSVIDRRKLLRYHWNFREAKICVKGRPNGYDSD